MEDFNRLKMISHRLVHVEFQHPWEWRVEIETEQTKTGGITLTFPAGTQPVTFTLTMRDFKDRRFYRWFEKTWVPKVVNPDGTFNLPFNYLRKFRRISLINPEDIETWKVLPTKLGDITESQEGQGFLEFPITMVQFRSVG